MFEGIRKVVAFFAHTDDEMVAAGTLHRLASRGVRVSVLTAAPAAIEADRTGTARSLEVVTPEWHRSLGTIGVAPQDRHFLGLVPSADLHPFRQRVCQWIYDFCESEKPDVAFVLSPHDENPAHALVAVESERVLRGRVPVAVRCQFPWNFSGFRPNLYVRLDEEDLRVKRAVIDAYESQRFRYDYGDMLLNYAVADGLSTKVPAAEKFEVIRAVIL